MLSQEQCCGVWLLDGSIMTNGSTRERIVRWTFRDELLELSSTKPCHCYLYSIVPVDLMNRSCCQYRTSVSVLYILDMITCSQLNCATDFHITEKRCSNSFAHTHQNNSRKIPQFLSPKLVPSLAAVALWLDEHAARRKYKKSKCNFVQTCTPVVAKTTLYQ